MATKLSTYRRDGKLACPRCGNTTKESPLRIVRSDGVPVRFHLCEHCLSHMKPADIQAMAIHAEMDLYQKTLEAEWRRAPAGGR